MCWWPGAKEMKVLPSVSGSSEVGACQLNCKPAFTVTHLLIYSVSTSILVPRGAPLQAPETCSIGPYILISRYTTVRCLGWGQGQAEQRNGQGEICLPDKGRFATDNHPRRKKKQNQPDWLLPDQRNHACYFLWPCSSFSVCEKDMAQHNTVKKARGQRVTRVRI